VLQFEVKSDKQPRKIARFLQPVPWAFVVRIYFKLFASTPRSLRQRHLSWVAPTRWSASANNGRHNSQPFAFADCSKISARVYPAVTLRAFA
jgi:hypothetical protein